MNIAAGSLISLAYRILGIASLTVMTMLLARLLSTDELGRFNVLLAAIGGVGAVAGSYASSAGYFISNRRRPEAEVASNVMFLGVLSGLLFAAIGFAAWLVYDGDYRDAVLVTGIAMFPIVARAGLGGVYLGSGALWRYSFSAHGFGLVGIALVLLVVWLFDQRTGEAALAVWVGAQYVAVVLLSAWDWRWWKWFANHRPDGALIRDILKYGAFTGLAGFVSYFNYRVDQFLVVGFDGESANAYYGNAVRVAEGLWLFSTTIAIASYASVGSLGRHEAAAVTAEGVRHTLLVVTVLALPIFVLAPILLRILFGGDYDQAATALRILCLGTLIYAPQSVISNYYSVQLGKPWISLAVAACSVCISIVVSAVLIPRIGYEGGAWGTAVSYAITSIGSTVLFLRLSDVHFNDLWRIRREDVMSYVRLARRVRERFGATGAPAEQQS